MAQKRSVPGCLICGVVVIWLIVWLVLLAILPASHADIYKRDLERRAYMRVLSQQRRSHRLSAWASADSTSSGHLWTLDEAEERPPHWKDRCRMLVERNAAYLERSHVEVPATGRVTLVSGLFDLGRGELDNDFKRPFSYYVERFEAFLQYSHPKVIFVESRYWEVHYKALVEKYHSDENPIHVVFKSIDDIEHEFPFYDEVQRIRTHSSWSEQTGVGGWLSQSPQATLRLYNPMVMSKIYWTRDVAQLNPFGTDSFMWIDGGHQCNDPAGLDREKMKFFQEEVFDKLLITYFDYVPSGEIHGFEKHAFFRYAGVKSIGQATEVIVGRGGIFGGTKEYLEVATLVYHEMLSATITHGFMGTEENIFALLWYITPELVHRYDNKEGGNCAVFQEAVHGPPPPPIIWEEHVMEFGFDLRGCTCFSVEGGEDYCVDDGGRQCPSYVTPMFLTKAEHQYACQLKDEYFCTIGCIEGDVYWYAHSCEDLDECPPPQHAPTPFGSHVQRA